MNNRFPLIRKITWGVIVLLAIGIVVTKMYISSSGEKNTLLTMGSVPEFSFFNQDSQAVSQNIFLNKVTIADFIFTTCAGPCPIMSGRMQQLQHEFIGEPLVQLASFSVDPEYDTPSVLSEYASRFNAVTGKWIFLTGEKKTMYALIQKGFHLGVEADSNAIIHSTKFVLVDDKASIRGYYDSEDEQSIAKLISDTKTLVEELR
jgi:protein SCO1/2